VLDGQQVLRQPSQHAAVAVAQAWQGRRSMPARLHQSSKHAEQQQQHVVF
jgi:hypothetical protein